MIPSLIPKLISVRKHHILHESKLTNPPPSHLCLFHRPIKILFSLNTQEKKEVSGHVGDIHRLAVQTGAFVMPWGAMTVVSLY